MIRAVPTFSFSRNSQIGWDRALLIARVMPTANTIRIAAGGVPDEPPHGNVMIAPS